MGHALTTIKLRCHSWPQLESIYRRDLLRGGLFLKASRPPPIGTRLRVNLELPSETLIVLMGHVSEHVPPGGMNGRGPGIDIKLNAIPQSAMWLIEAALSSSRNDPSAPAPHPTDANPAADLPRQSGAESAAVDEASLEEGNQLVEAENELVEALQNEYNALKKLNPFQVLNLGYDATDEQVRTQFGQLTKRYHPDRFARYQSREAREYASEIFILLRDAYRRLHSAESRQKTLQAVREADRTAAPRPATNRPITAAPPPPAPRNRPPPIPEPRRRADSLLSPHELFGAEGGPAVSQPVEIASPKKSAAVADHSAAKMLLAQGKYDEALALYGLAIKRAPDDTAARAGAELASGLKALAQRDRLEAAQRFEVVLELDPKNERAARELAEIRRQATNDRKGLLARLLGKKV